MSRTGPPDRGRGGPRLDVLQVIATTDRRGPEVFAVDLGAELARRGRTEATVAVVAGDSTRQVAAPALGATRWSPGGLWSLGRLMARSDVVVAHSSHALPACTAASLASGTPFVWRNWGDPLYWVNNRWRHARVRLMLSRAAAVAALWPGSAEIIVRELGVPRSKVEVVPTGRPKELFPLAGDEERRSARARLAIEPPGPLALYLGALAPEKRADLAVAAVAGLEQVTLAIVGDGPQRPEVEALARDLAPGRVWLMGATDDTASWLAAADVLVLPSDSEGVPGVLVEAGLTGIPAVATNVGGVAEVVLDGVSGVLVPPGDAEALRAGLRSVLARAQEMGLAAHEHCTARFELGVVGGIWDDFLASVAGR